MQFVSKNANDWIFFKETASTNDVLLNGDYLSGTVCLTKHQTRGRGRQGKKWLNVKNDSFIFSALLVFDNRRDSDIIKNKLSFFPLITGLALKKAAEDIKRKLGLSIPRLSLKWPNDVYLLQEGKARKLGGLLIEIRTVGRHTKVVIGIGMNWSSAPVVKEADILPTSLFTENESPPPSSEFTDILIQRMNELLYRLYADEKEALVSEINKCFFLKDRLVKIEESVYKCLALGKTGGLLVYSVNSGNTKEITDIPSDFKIL